jgi:protein-S-isoprenylcysteine O-methyltransferase Ste14
MFGFVVGLTLWSPTALTLSALVAAYLSLEIQIRFEEQYLERVHGAAYGSYRAKVRRWL